MLNQNILKKKLAIAALDYIQPASIIGVGSGSTINHFIDALASIKHKIEGVVPASLQTEKRLSAYGIRSYDLNEVDTLEWYIDSADEFNLHRQLIKGGGGALTREKIIATAAKKFLCIADGSKKVPVLGVFPVAIEVIPMARSVVARELVKLGANPTYRAGFVTDNKNVILDVRGFDLLNPLKLEEQLNNIPGILENGIFAHRRADILLVANESGINCIE